MDNKDAGKMESSPVAGRKGAPTGGIRVAEPVAEEPTMRYVF